MEDEKILALYCARDEAALAATQEKYGGYCRAIAGAVLGDPADAEEIVSDALLGAWNAIPPHRPENLRTFLGKLTRRAALKKYRAAMTRKRGGGQTALALEELAEVLPAGGGPEETVAAGELSAALDRFLGGLPPGKRRVFLRRYWYLDSVERIAEAEGCTTAKISSILHRLREKLRMQLEKAKKGTVTIVSGPGSKKGEGHCVLRVSGSLKAPLSIDLDAKYYIDPTGKYDQEIRYKEYKVVVDPSGTHEIERVELPPMGHVSVRVHATIATENAYQSDAGQQFLLEGEETVEKYTTPSGLEAFILLHLYDENAFYYRAIFSLNGARFTVNIDGEGKDHQLYLDLTKQILDSFS